MPRRIVRGLAIAALVIGYPLLAHYTNVSAHNDTLGAWVAIAPLILIALVMAWRSPKRTIMLSVLVLTCGVLWTIWPTLEHHFGLVYWLQHAGIQLILFMIFGRTLFAGRKPLCTQFAEAVHAPLTPQHEIYAGQVTLAWTLFFGVMALTSTLLFFLTPLSTWSVFANFLTPLLVVLVFIAEYVVRRWALPEARHQHILDAVRAFRSTAARPH